MSQNMHHLKRVWSSILNSDKFAHKFSEWTNTSRVPHWGIITDYSCISGGCWKKVFCWPSLFNTLEENFLFLPPQNFNIFNVMIHVFTKGSKTVAKLEKNKLCPPLDTWRILCGCNMNHTLQKEISLPCRKKTWRPPSPAEIISEEETYFNKILVRESFVLAMGQSTLPKQTNKQTNK